METRISSATKEVVISLEKPVVLIGERINPTGRRKLTESLQAGSLELVQRDAVSQVKAGADVLDVNVGAAGVDKILMLARAVQAVMEVTDVPLCLDSDSPPALEAALKVYRGKAIINSVTGQEDSLKSVLPLVRNSGAAVIALTMDDEGIPQTAEKRVAIARKIVERAEKMGIPRQDVIIDCIVMTVGSDSKAGAVTLDAIRRVRDELGLNQTIGTSNISFGLPEREVLTAAFLTLAIAAGVTCPTVNVLKVRQSVLATDLLLGRDNHALRYIRGFRQLQALAKEQAKEG